ncbi:unnamed protein product [Caenorhabditis brenneri]
MNCLTYPWNPYLPPVASWMPERLGSHSSSWSLLSDFSSSSAQAPVNLENQSPTASRIQCLWCTTDGKICNQLYQSPEELAAHVNSSHMPQKGILTCHWKGCDRLGRPFKTRYNLVSHVRVHTGETPFECDLCGKQFARAQNLQLHRRWHTGEKPCVCPVEGCSKRFTCSSDLGKHKKTHLGLTPSFGCKSKHKKDSSGTPGFGTYSPRTDASNFCQSPAPEYHNLPNIPSYCQVEHPGFYGYKDQMYCYPYNNYAYPPM